MVGRGVPVTRTVFTLALILVWSWPQPAGAGCVRRPLTGGEQAFYRQAADVSGKAMAAPKGWRRLVTWMNVPDRVCEGFENNPIPYVARFKFTRITESEKIQEAMDRRNKEQTDLAMAAHKRGDAAEADKIMARMQEENTRDMNRRMQALQKETAGPRPRPMTARVKINDKRKAIGKKFEIQAMANTVKTFETVQSPGTDNEYVSKILLIGNWRVEDFMKNWSLIRPDVPYDAIGGIHLSVSGRRADVEGYLTQTARIGLLAEAAH